MCLLCSLRAFTEKQPPEGTDHFVCENPADPQKRTYGIMRFFKKGSLFPELMHIETGYYFLETGNQDGTDTAVWLQSTINPLDSVYAVINPEE